MRYPLIQLAALSFGLAFLFLGIAPAVTMEGIIADGAEYMRHQGNWAVPHLYGEIYTYKPPLAQWLVAASFTLFGKSVASLRLPFALSGALAALCIFWIVRRRTGHTDEAKWSAIATMTGVLGIQKLRLAETDVLLAAGTGIAMLCAASNLVGSRATVRGWLLCYAALSFGFLAKGTPALLFYGCGLLVAAQQTGRLSELLRREHVIGIALFLVTIGAWAMLAWNQSKGTAFDQPLREGIARSTTWSWPALGMTLLKPVTLVAVFAPWSFYLPAALQTTPRRATANIGTRDSFALALAGFLFAGLVLMMLVPKTHTRYLLPLTYPVGALVGLHIARRGATEALVGRGEARALVAGLLIGGAGSLAVAAEAFGVVLPLAARALALVIGLTGLCTGLNIWRTGRSFPKSCVPKALLGISVSFWCVFALGLDLRRAERRSLGDTASRFAAIVPADEPVWVDLDDEHSNLFFDLDRVVRRFDLEGDFPPLQSWIILQNRQEAELKRNRERVSLAARSTSGRTLFSLWRVEE